MSTITKKLKEEAKSYVFHRLETELPAACTFHAPDHTRSVLENALTIGRGSGFSDADLDCLEMAALFHDLGYIKAYAGHEQESAQMAAEFFSQRQLDPVIVEQLEQAILATRVPQSPKNPISAALCDADLMHLALPDYFEVMELLRAEWKLTGRSDLSLPEFHQQSLKFFEQHQYHTPWSKSNLEPGKEWNRKRILDQLSEINRPE